MNTCEEACIVPISCLAFMSCCDHDHGDLEEMRHFAEVGNSFLTYFSDAGEILDKKTRTALLVNAKFLRESFACAAPVFGMPLPPNIGSIPSNSRNISKMRSTLKQFVREWAIEGKEERDQSFGPLVGALTKYVPVRGTVICPGSGIGRLPYEIANLGYETHLNEFSYHMLISAYFVLNGIEGGVGSKLIFPYALNYAHSLGEKERLTPVRIPDEFPTVHGGGSMNMAAGEFVDVFTDWPTPVSAVVTCFFIDTAKNLLVYIRTIARLVRPGGLWANMGPLLYHYAEQADEISLEFSYEEIREFIGEYFDIVEEKTTDSPCVYSSSPNSLSQTEYQCIFFAAIRNHVEVTGESNPVY
jgi:carnosine N-methyltransferase